jgi:CRP-like cAMP-binding protein
LEQAKQREQEPMDFIWNNIFRKRTKDEADIADLIKKVPIFEDLNRLELKEFLRISHLRTYKPGEIIFYEGEPGVGMYIIQKGRVRIFKEAEEGKTTELAVLEDGDFFGELALLDDSPRSACAMAITETKVIGIFRPDLFSLFERKPKLGNKVLLRLANMIGQRLKATNEQLQQLTREKEATGADR